MKCFLYKFILPKQKQKKVLLLKKQLVLVQEDANGLVQNATTVQLAGALDDLYASAASLSDLGATVSGGSTRFRLWAPTAQAVRVYTYAASSGDPLSIDGRRQHHDDRLVLATQGSILEERPDGKPRQS